MECWNCGPSEMVLISRGKNSGVLASGVTPSSRELRPGGWSYGSERIIDYPANGDILLDGKILNA